MFILLETRILNDNAHNGQFFSTEHATFEFSFYKMITLYFTLYALSAVRVFSSR